MKFNLKLKLIYKNYYLSSITSISNFKVWKKKNKANSTKLKTIIKQP